MRELIFEVRLRSSSNLPINYEITEMRQNIRALLDMDSTLDVANVVFLREHPKKEGQP